jgi:hypothetical protein
MRVGRRQKFEGGVGILAVVLLAAAAAVGCDRRPLELGDDAGTSDDAGSTGGCVGLDQAHCTSTAGCAITSCASCAGDRTFACYRPGVDPVPSCPDFRCAPGPACTTLDQGGCAARSDCQVLTCPSCTTAPTYMGCDTVGAPAPTCIPNECIVEQPCGVSSTLADCEARSDCHAVYYDSGACDCAFAGCCTGFSFCAPGAKATCTPPKGACAGMAPYCESPAYVISYVSGCPEGCVKPDECGP